MTTRVPYRSAIEFTTSDDRWAPHPSWEVEMWPLEEEDRIDPGDHWFKRDFQAWPGEIAAGGGRRLEFFRQDYLSMRPWLPTAAYLGLWLAMLAFWQRRKARRWKAAAVATP